jgi:hypothetical protein
MKLEVYDGVIVRPVTGRSTCDTCCFHKLDACDTANCSASQREDKTNVTFELYRVPVKVTRTISIVPVKTCDWLLLMEDILMPAYSHQTETRFDYRCEPYMLHTIHIDCFMDESEFQKFLCWLLNRMEKLGVNYNGI